MEPNNATVSSGFNSAALLAAATVWNGMIVLCLVYWAICKRRRRQSWHGPKAWPVLGAHVEAARNYSRILDWMTGFFDHDHRTMTLHTIGRTSYITVDPANIEHILKTNFSNYPKGPFMHLQFFDLFGNGILNTDGKLWRSHRKLASPEFSIRKLKTLGSTVYTTHALKLLDVLATKASQGVDMQALLLAMTFDSICEVVLGEELDTLSSSPDCHSSAVAKAIDTAQELITLRFMVPWWRILKYLDVGFEKILKQELAKLKHFVEAAMHKKRMQLIDQLAASRPASSSSDSSSSTTAAASNPSAGDEAGWASSSTAAASNPSVDDEARWASSSSSRSNASGMGDEARGAAVPDAPDLLSRFMLDMAREHIAPAGASGVGSSSNPELRAEIHESPELVEVRDAMVSFILAGRDTTGSTLSWLLYRLCSHPEKQERVFQELLELETNDRVRSTASHDHHHHHHDHQEEQEDAAQGYDHGSMQANPFRRYAELLTYHNLQTKVPYLHAAIAETLRLHPAVPRDGKTTLQDDVLPDGTQLKAGQSITYLPYAMGRMPFLWGDDALEFKPERWLWRDDDGKLCIRPESPFKFPVFQAGPRMCLGKDAAYLQMKITAALLLRFFRFELLPGHPIAYRMLIVLSMKHGLRLNFSPRPE